jgi:hypothetical protein
MRRDCRSPCCWMPRESNPLTTESGGATRFRTDRNAKSSAADAFAFLRPPFPLPPPASRRCVTAAAPPHPRPLTRGTDAILVAHQPGPVRYFVHFVTNEARVKSTAGSGSMACSNTAIGRWRDAAFLRARARRVVKYHFEELRGSGGRISYGFLSAFLYVQVLRMLKRQSGD